MNIVEDFNNLDKTTYELMSVYCGISDNYRKASNFYKGFPQFIETDEGKENDPFFLVGLNVN